MLLLQRYKLKLKLPLDKYGHACVFIVTPLHNDNWGETWSKLILNPAASHHMAVAGVY